MRVVPRPIVCDRVRAQVSLRLDGELSELESRMVVTHLAQCEECAAFEADLAGMTHELRTAPLEPLSRAVVVRGPVRTWMPRAQVGVAAALAIAVLGTVSQLASIQGQRSLRAPDKYPTTRQLSSEVDQIISDGKAFMDTAGPVVPI